MTLAPFGPSRYIIRLALQYHVTLKIDSVESSQAGGFGLIPVGFDDQVPKQLNACARSTRKYFSDV